MDWRWGRTMRKKSSFPVKLGYAGTNLIVLFFSLSAMFPIVWMLYTSFKTNKEFSLSTMSLPSSPTLTNYSNAFNVGNIGSAIFSSLFNTVIAVPLIIIFSSSAIFFPGLNLKAKKSCCCCSCPA
jgi:raffinose/stachyose/melibiose transport system permease protein